MFDKLKPVFAGETLSFEAIHQFMDSLKKKAEPLLKQHLKDISQAGFFGKS